METEEFLVDHLRLRSFIANVRAVVSAMPIEAALAELEPSFQELLADQSWLPAEFQRSDERGQMGGGIATWLIYRSAERDLSLFSLVVPPATSTPVHDHLAWGLVGLYAGQQAETVYAQTGARHGDHAELQVVERQMIQPGDCYRLIPPDGDIHSVTTTSPGPSVSIHLLGNDTGCTWRHAYEPAHNHVRDFRSGWSNVPCRDDNAS